MVLFMEKRIEKIRESEKRSHIEMYSNEELYKSNGWMKKPIKIIQELLPLFEGYQELQVLDLGCGVGRNSIAIARAYQNINCIVECVDILELAIEKLYMNASEHGVAPFIRGYVDSIENYVIGQNCYDFIIAVSALEHVETEDAFVKKLREIRDGIRDNGIVCMVVNSDVKERDKDTGVTLPAQFEVNYSTENLQRIMNDTFRGWKVIKSTVKEQQYDIPRENGISNLTTNVVTLVVRKCDDAIHVEENS